MTLCKYIFTLSLTDRLSIVAKVSGILSQNNGFILELSQYGDSTTKQFFMRCVFEISPSKLEELKKCLSSAFEDAFFIDSFNHKPKTIIMVSKQGHCLNYLLYQWKMNYLPIDIQMIISNHPDLEKMAKWYQIPFLHLPITKDTRKPQETEILAQIQKNDIELIVLARYMQILSSDFTKKLFGKVINIHHSFLPSFKGAKPYHQAYEKGVKLIGATAHYVNDELDEGPIIEQEVIPVNHSHSPKDLIQMGSDIESRVLSRAVKHHCEKKVFINGKKTVVFS